MQNQVSCHLFKNHGRVQADETQSPKTQLTFTLSLYRGPSPPSKMDEKRRRLSASFCSLTWAKFPVRSRLGGGGQKGQDQRRVHGPNCAC